MNPTPLNSTLHPRHRDAAPTGRASIGPNDHRVPAVAGATRNATSFTRPVDLRLLVISVDGREAGLQTIIQTLRYLGTPYTLYIASRHPGQLTPSLLSSAERGYYQGVILATSELSTSAGYAGADGVATSALSAEEWRTLRGYEAQFGVRELIWYAFPSAECGFGSLAATVETEGQPLHTRFTKAAWPLFPYVNHSAPLVIRGAYTYLAPPLDDGHTVPLLVDDAGHVVALLRKLDDGRETLAVTCDSNPALVHSLVLAYGLINWVTRGIFLGERHIYLGVQVDDMFLEAHTWPPNTPCDCDPEATGTTFRLTGDDLARTVAWLRARRQHAVTTDLRLQLAFNGIGADSPPEADTLLPAARRWREEFCWVNHTYDHANLDSVSFAEAQYQIVANDETAARLRLGDYSPTALVTPDVSGLANTEFLRASYEAGVRFLVTDSSRPGEDNPTPNAGFCPPGQPALLLIPRRPTNLFYNVTTPEEWVAAYNCLYAEEWGRALGIEEILDVESETLLRYLLKGDIDPLMFHQTNLRAYDGVHSLLGDVLDRALAKYEALFTLPICALPLHLLGLRMASRMSYDAAGVRATLLPGGALRISVERAATVPITGLHTPGAERYGDQEISYISLAAGQSLSLPLI